MRQSTVGPMPSIFVRITSNHFSVTLKFHGLIIRIQDIQTVILLLVGAWRQRISEISVIVDNGSKGDKTDILIGPPWLFLPAPLLRSVVVLSFNKGNLTTNPVLNTYPLIIIIISGRTFKAQKQQSIDNEQLQINFLFCSMFHFNDR